jgi:UDP-glucose 4-epimerase
VNYSPLKWREFLLYLLNIKDPDVGLSVILMISSLTTLIGGKAFMAILLTGGAGYIGSHICIELLNAGYDVAIVDNFSNSKPETINRVREITKKDVAVYTADIRDRAALSRIFEDDKIDAVIHLAGLKAVGESTQKPIEYYDNNIYGTLALCDVMRTFGVKKIVFSSSATVYGQPKKVPITEDFPISATNPYGRTKLMIENILQDIYASDNEWSISILRYFNPVGAHHSGQIGEDPNGIPNNLMPYITQVAVGKLPYLKVFGNDYPTPDGTGVRDYIHVVDLALGHLKALQEILPKTGVSIYNLGTGKGYSVLQMIKAFEDASGKKIPYQITDRRPGDIPECYADPTKAKMHLKWSAEKGIEDMCRDAWRWQSQNPRGYEA